MPNPTTGPLTPPPFLAQMSKAAIRRLEPDTLLRDALAATNPDDLLSSLAAFWRLEGKLAAAKRQQRRIARPKRQLQRGIRSRNRGTVFDDIHFYLICWTRIAKLSRYFVRTTHFPLPRVRHVLRQYRTKLNKMIEARDHLEHFEGALGDHPKYGRENLPDPNDLFNLVGDHMSFGGTRYDVGPESMKLLARIVGDLRKATLFDSLEVLADANRELLVKRLQDAERAVATDRVVRQVRRDLQ